jgi:protein required for attachment to host cells
MPVCVLVADAGRARIFHARGTARARYLEEAEDLVSPAARLARREVASDATGRVFARARGGAGPRVSARSGADSDSDPRAEELKRFAARVSRRLDVHRRAGNFDDLRIAAAPRFLGALRDALSAPTRLIVTRELARDISRMTPAAIARAMLAR